LSWLLSILGLLIAGGILGIAYDFLSGRRAERRELRREGAAVITPVSELVNGLGPESIMFGSNEQISGYLDEVRRRWWEERRPALLQYGNHHPSERVRRFANELVDAVGNTLASTIYLWRTLNTATNMDAFNEAQQRKQEALAKADELMTEIRRGGLRWPQRPHLRTSQDDATS
jgi:hypothetical protein